MRRRSCRAAVAAAILAAVGAASAAVLPPSRATAAPEACGLYQYRAAIVRVIDGDTVVADIDLGFSIWRRGERLRLAGIDAPEPRGATRAAGLVSAAALRARIEGRELVICTLEDRTGSFGRYLVLIYDEGGLVNEWLLREGHARPWPG